jgi:protein-S-isoprenylcysteine O-methyltransferase
VDASAKAVLEAAIPFWVASEILLGIVRRARGAGDRSTDRGSSFLLWGSILGGVVLSVGVRASGLGGSAAGVPGLHSAALALLVIGLALRWWAILTLGRLFTMTLAVREGHEVVTDGPYRWVRHPAYAGMLVCFAGCGLWMGSWLSLAALLVPIGAAVLRRIRVEEAALVQALGEPYERYRRSTSLLIPGLF